MKQLKKLISIILCLCLFSGHVHAANPYDVEDTYLLKVLHVLSCFDILYEAGSTDNFRPNDPMPRAEAVSDVLKLIGQEIIDYDETHEPSFTDVGADSECFDILETAANIGIVAGYGEEFRPQSNISYSEFTRMICVALGYDNAAQLSGGYPTGYVNIASQININKRVKVTTGDLTRRDYAVVLYNALSAPMMTISGVNGEMKSDPEKNLLSDVHDAISGKGIVTANKYTTLYTAGGTGNGTIKIDDMPFFTGETNADAFVGYYVEYFAKEDEHGDYVLLDIWADEERFVELDSTDIIPERSGMGAIYFQPKGTSRVEKYKIETNADLIYNSQARVFDNVSLITPASGKVVLSDTDNNDVYDVVIVTDYTVKIAESASESTQKVFFKDNTGSVELDEETYADCIIVKDGKEISIEEVKEWDVLHIAYPPDASTGKIEIVVTGKTATGKITSKGIEEISINDVVYKVSKAYSAVRLPNAKPGQSVVAMLDIFGYIVDVQPMADSEICGYLYEVKYLDEDDQGRFTIFTQNNEWIKVKTAEKVKFNDRNTKADAIVAALQCEGDANGVKVDASGYMIDVWDRYVKYAADGVSFEVTDENGKVMGAGLPQTQPITDRQMVMFSLNEEGLLKTITQADAVTNGSGFKMHGDYTADPGVMYRDGMRGFWVNVWSGGNVYPSFYADEDTFMFMIPFENPDDKDWYNVEMGGYSYFGNEDFNWKVRTYGFEDDPQLGYVPYLMTEAEGGGTKTTKPVIVEKIHIGINEDDEVVYVLSGYLDGKLSEWLVESEEILKKRTGEMLKFGDVVTLNVKTDGSMESIVDSTDYYGATGIVFDTSYTDAEQIGSCGTSYRGNQGKVIGYVTGVDYTKKRIAVETNEGDVAVSGMPIVRVLGLWRTYYTSQVYVVDRTDKSITVGNINDVEIGDFVACGIGNSNVRAVVIYRD